MPIMSLIIKDEWYFKAALKDVYAENRHALYIVYNIETACSELWRISWRDTHEVTCVCARRLFSTWRLTGRTLNLSLRMMCHSLSTVRNGVVSLDMKNNSTRKYSKRSVWNTLNSLVNWKASTVLCKPDILYFCLRLFEIMLLDIMNFVD